MKPYRETLKKMLPTFSIIVTIIGLVLTVFSIFTGIKLDSIAESQKQTEKMLVEEREKLKLKEEELVSINWNDMQNAAKHLAMQIKKDFTPDFIITPGQKGGIFGYLISEFYDTEIPIITGYLISQTELKPTLYENNLLIENDKWYLVLPNEILVRSNQKVLIVDDCVFGGTTMSQLKNLLLNNGYMKENVKTCALVASKLTYNHKKIPDYFWKPTLSDDFFLPWGKAK